MDRGEERVTFVRKCDPSGCIASWNNSDIDIYETDRNNGAMYAALATALVGASGQLLLNVAKHAGTSEARLTLDWSPESLLMVIDDDGIGFDPKEALAVVFPCQ